MYRVRVASDDKEIPAPDDVSLLDTLAKHGVALTSPCGGEGTCGKCRIQATGDLNPPTIAERTLLGDLVRHGFRLSCQCIPQGDIAVTIPDSSRVPSIRILAGGARRDVPFFPNVRRRSFTWKKLELDDTGSQFDVVARLLNARADLVIDLPEVRELSRTLKEGQTYDGTIIGNRLVEVEPTDPDASVFGVALDIGTTTVVAHVIDLRTGESVGTASALNDQTHYGGDVISRINHATSMDNGLQELQDAVLTTVNRCFDMALERSDKSLSDIYEISVVGNTTMLHLFAGVYPRSLGQLPYSPVFSHGLDVPPNLLGLDTNPRGNVHLLPSIAGYVGADTVGAMIAASFDEDTGKTRLLADIGTNCELVLQRGGELIACSTPAGPAFEGARMDYGMMAGPGAIERVEFGEDVVLRVIGDATPIGICGSGVVDIAAELYRAGILDETGRIQSADDLVGIVSPLLCGRLHEQEKGTAFELATNDDGEPILFTQKDVREIQLAKAAIRSGIETLLDVAGVKADDLNEVLIAGGFGNYLNKENARLLGMIPDIPLERVRFVGNAALVGARLALVSYDMRTRAAKLAHTIRHIQIAGTPNFRMRFTEAMLFGDGFLM